VPTSLDAAKNATTTFHDQIDQGRYDAIYDETTTATFKSAQTREHARALMKSMNRRLGACTASRLIGENFQMAPQGTFVNLTYVRNCANGDLNEQLTWQIVGGKALLAAFNASSPALLAE